MKMKRLIWLRRLKPLALLLGLAVFFLADIEADAAIAKKETPLTNLAKGKTTVTANEGTTLNNVGKLTDGDKYGLIYNSTTNKNGGTWETYNEVDNSTTASGNRVWIQLDLGASYPIEVINLKRQVYSGTPTISNPNGQHARLSGTTISYESTAIVIGNDPNLSDGYVVYYQGDFDLPRGVNKPTASARYTEPMGGQWFYMDYSNNGGLGATELGTTKTARYVRVYSKNPSGSTVNFMELGVYGYKTQEKAEEAAERKDELRRTIDNENPLLISTAYSNDIYAIGQQEEPTLQGFATVSDKCRVIPEDLKENTVLMLHTNNLRQFSPQHIGQANVQGFYEHGLQVCYENDTDAMLMTIGASAVEGGAHWYPIRDLDVGWVDLMYRMYPNLHGTINSENYWSNHFPAVSRASAKQLVMADRFGGYFIWADADSKNLLASVFSNNNNYKDWTSAIKSYGDHFFMTYKNTSAGSYDLRTTSYIQGNWLAGYSAGWGMLSDTWFWKNKGWGVLWGGGGQEWQKITGVPEALLGAQMLSTYLNGGVIYTFEFPEIVYGVEDKASPAYTHVVSRLFRYFKENPAPGRKEVLENTKVLLYGTVDNAIYSATVGSPGGLNLYQNGRYGVIPVVLPMESKDEVIERLQNVAAGEGVTALPAVMETDNAAVRGAAAAQYFQGLYEKEYEGTAFADKRNNTWYVYNSVPNTNTEQNAILPIKSTVTKGARVGAALSPHTYFMLKEGENGTTLELSLNNYRINKDRYVFANSENRDWSGSSVPGVGLNGKISVYNYMKYNNVVNADPSKGENSPDDNELRTTTFTISKLAKKPKVELIAGQEADTDNMPQYESVQVDYNQDTGMATIIVTSNGWVEYRISELEWIEYNGEILTADEVKETNLALQKEMSYSVNVSNDRRTHGTDGNTSKDNYADFGSNAQWMQVNLGALCQVDRVKMYRYQDRQYYNTVILLSPESDFPGDKTLVLWNANGTNGGKNSTAVTSWPGNINGSTGGTHTLPTGNEQTYTETVNGKEFTVYESRVTWLDGQSRELPTKESGFMAQYVRVYMNGSNANVGNHVVDLQVYGKIGKVELVDNTPPTQPKDVAIKARKLTEATIGFTPSVDDLGMKEYEVTYTNKSNLTAKKMTVSQAIFTLSGLEKDTEYDVTIKAVDNHDNWSTASIPITVDTKDSLVGISVNSGRYETRQEVTLTQSANVGTIYYTLDGSKPLDAEGQTGASAMEYTGTPIAVEQPCVLQVAIKDSAFGYPYSTSARFYQIGNIQIGDFTAPNSPSALTLTSVYSDGAKLTWGSDAPDVEAFYVYLNGAKHAEVQAGSGAMEITLAGLQPLTAYQLWVTAVDGAGNESLRSKTVELITSSQ